MSAVRSFEDHESSVVSGVSYNDDNFQLFVETKQGSVYRYDGVPASMFTDFFYSSSRGKFWNENIQGNFARASQVDFRPRGTPLRSRTTPALDQFEVTYEVTGTITVTVEASNWDEAASLAADEVSEHYGLNKTAVSIKRKA